MHHWSIILASERKGGSKYSYEIQLFRLYWVLVKFPCKNIFITFVNSGPKNLARDSKFGHKGVLSVESGEIDVSEVKTLIVKKMLQSDLLT